MITRLWRATLGSDCGPPTTRVHHFVMRLSLLAECSTKQKSANASAAFVKFGCLLAMYVSKGNEHAKSENHQSCNDVERMNVITPQNSRSCSQNTIYSEISFGESAQKHQKADCGYYISPYLHRVLSPVQMYESSVRFVFVKSRASNACQVVRR